MAGTPLPRRDRAAPELTEGGEGSRAPPALWEPARRLLQERGVAGLQTPIPAPAWPQVAATSWWARGSPADPCSAPGWPGVVAGPAEGSSGQGHLGLVEGMAELGGREEGLSSGSRKEDRDGLVGGGRGEAGSGGLSPWLPHLAAVVRGGSALKLVVGRSVHGQGPSNLRSIGQTGRVHRWPHARVT